MPALNDLTPEEEAAFVQHGVQPAGPGGEPVNENDGNENDDGGEQQQNAEPTIEVTRDPETGRFLPKNKDASPAPTDQTTQQGQENQGQQGQENQGQQPQQNQQQQMVPHQALHAEREANRQLRSQMQVLQTRMNQLLTMQQGQQNQPTQMPNLAENPVEYIQTLEQRLAAFEQRNQQDQQFAVVDSSLDQDEALFAASQPDYDQASDYYVQSRARELAMFHTPEQIQQLLTQEVRQIAQQAWQRGQSAAGTVYRLAQARGYVLNPNGGQQVPQNQGQQNQGQQNQGQQRGPTPAAVVAAAQNGQQQSRSLSGGMGGGNDTQMLNAQALLAMSDEEFEAAFGLGQKGANVRFQQLAGN